MQIKEINWCNHANSFVNKIDNTSKHWMPIHYDMIENGQNEITNVLFPYNVTHLGDISSI